MIVGSSPLLLPCDESREVLEHGQGDVTVQHLAFSPANTLGTLGTVQHTTAPAGCNVPGIDIAADSRQQTALRIGDPLCLHNVSSPI